MKNFSLLPTDKTFRQLLLPYLLPYFLYVLPAYLPLNDPSGFLGQIMRFTLVASALFGFRKHYQMGIWKNTHAFIALAAFPVALLLWIGPMYLLGYFSKETSGTASVQAIYIVFRVLNAAILVAVFEELLMRVFFMEYGYSAGKMEKSKGILNKLFDTLDNKPAVLDVLPLNMMSLVFTTLIFTAGHSPKEYISALLYFSYTNFLYYKTKSLWLCILVHGFTNLALVFSTAYFHISFP